jgi:type II secretory pathway pseudopilin PulG
MTARSPRAGVTLLETLIGLLVMAMVAALLSAAFGTNLRLLSRSQVSAASVDQALARRDFRTWLEHALEGPVPNDPRPLFAGTATELRFLSVPPGGQFWPGTATDVSFGPEPTALGTGTAPDHTAEVGLAVALAPLGTRVTLDYWGRAAPDQSPEWRNQWDPSLGVPDLVRITFLGDGTLPPPMVIRPAKAWHQSEMSLSSLVPPALPSRP